MENTPPNLEKKLDEILLVLQKIEKQGQKSLWQSGAKFAILNFAKIIASALTIFLLWQIWGVVDGILGSVDFLKESATGFFDKFLESGSSLKFWK